MNESQTKPSLVKRIAIGILVAVVVLLIVWWFFFRGGFGGVMTGSRELTVGLKWLHSANYAGMYVAKEKGFYEEAGLNVNLEEFDFKLDRLTGLKNGQFDLVIVGPPTLLQAVGEGEEFQAVMAVFQTSPYAFVSLKESGITKPADFQGKVLGNKGGNLEGELAYQAVLDSFGIDPALSDIIDRDFSTSELEDLISGAVDVIDLYRTNQPYHFEQAGVEYNLIKPEQYGLQTYDDIVVVTNNFINEDPGVVRSFISATVRGWEYAILNPDEAADITVKFVTREEDKTKERQSYTLERNISLIKPTGGSVIGTMRFVPWKALYDTLVSRNLIEKEFDVVDVYTNEFLVK